MKILLTNVQLDHRTGTEIVVRDLEARLRARGHDVCVYTPHLGIISDEISAAGGRVVDDLCHVPFSPDLIHGHHNGPATEASIQFADAPVVFVCHSRHHWLDMARGVPSVCEYVAVDMNCLERLAAEGIPADRLHLIPNAVDLTRFAQQRQIRTPLRRAVIFGNSAATSGGFADSVRRACARHGLPLDQFGSGVGRTLDDPEHRLGDYDIVFAKARCAIEALASGCAVIAVDEAGYGGLVTSSNVDWMLDWNVGDRCLQKRHDAAAIEEDLAAVDPEDVARVSAVVRRRCDLEVAVDAYERVYSAAVSRGRADSSPVADSWRDPYRAAVNYASELEAQLRAGEGAWAMPRLPPAAISAINIALDNSPRWIPPDSEFQVDVRIANSSRESLSTTGSTPVLLSYHWLDDSGSIVHFEGTRTALSAHVRGGTTHHQAMIVRSPSTHGRLTMHVTLVQEGVAWFSDLVQSCSGDARITVTSAIEVQTLAEIASLVGLAVVRDAPVSHLGFVSRPRPGMLTFATTERFAREAVRGGCCALILPARLVPQLPEGIGILESDTPAETFWALHEQLASRTDFYGVDEPTRIHHSARVHPTASVDSFNVVIGEGVVIGAGCVITGRVAIERGATVLPGAVIGTGGLQVLSIGADVVDYTHVGDVRICENAVVFANATIARGLFRQSTVIGAHCRIGNNAFVSHNTCVGDRSIIGHGAMVNGNVHIGTGVWVGPGATLANNIEIGDDARIGLGSTVIGTVRPGEHVGGPPAIDHHIVLREVASWRKRHRR